MTQKLCCFVVPYFRKLPENMPIYLIFNSCTYSTQFCLQFRKRGLNNFMQITVIIPVYNKIKYVEQTLRSISRQSFTDFECLMIDDGSTDGSGSICDEFAAHDNRFQVFHIPNGGVSRARNVGLAHAAGEYITFVDGDDLLHPGYLNNLYACIQRHHTDMVISPLGKFWGTLDTLEQPALPYHGLMALDSLLPEFANIQQRTGIYGFVAGKIFPKSLLKEITFNEKIRLAEDLDFYLSIYPRVQNIYFDNKCYYYYRQAAENSSMLGDGSNIDYLTQLHIQKKLSDFLEQKGFLSDENKTVMNQRLYDYVYFSLFHCQGTQVPAIFNHVRSLQLPPRKVRSDEPLFRKLLLLCYERNSPSVAVAILSLRRSLRRFIHKPSDRR